MICKDSRYVPDKMEDPAHVDERRKAIGMKQTLVEYEKMFDDNPPCG
jgi:hypothetical protein